MTYAYYLRRSNYIRIFSLLMVDRGLRNKVEQFKINSYHIFLVLSRLLFQIVRLMRKGLENI